MSKWSKPKEMIDDLTYQVQRCGSLFSATGV